MGQTESTVKETGIELQQEPVNISLSKQVFTRLTRESISPMRETEMKRHSEQARATRATRDYYMAGSTSATDVYQIDNQEVADKESEFTKNKEYWKKRLEFLQETQETIKTAMKEEWDQGFEDAAASLSSEAEGEKKEKPCAENLGNVAKCYQSNAKEPLTCDKEVDEFVSCVKTSKMETMKPKKKEGEESEEANESETKEVKPDVQNKQVKPSEGNKEVKPSEGNKEVKPSEGNKEVKPSEGNKEVKPSEGNKEAKPNTTDTKDKK